MPVAMAKTSAQAKQTFNIDKFSEKIQVVVSRPLYDVDTEELPRQLLPLLKDSPAVKALIITENIDNEVVLSFYRDQQENLVFNQDLPEKLSSKLKQLIQVSYDDEEVGNILIYFKEDKSSLSFNQAEQTWLDKNIPIRYVYDPDWAPFEWTNDIGKHAGIIADILKLIKNRTGLNLIPIKTKTWAEAVTYAKNRHADMYSAVGVTEARKSYMNFTEKNIFSTPYVFVSRQGEDYLEGFDSITDKKVAVVGGYTIHEMMKENSPDIPLVILTGTQQGFNKLLANEIDIFLVNAVTAKYFSRQEQYRSLKLAYKTKFKLSLEVAIRNDWPPEVISIFNKAIASLSEKEITEIYDKWTEIKVKTKIDYSLLYQVAASLLVLILLFVIWNRKLNALVNAKTKDIEAQKLALEDLSKNLEIKVKERTKELDTAHKRTQESIEYAALIQSALIPDRQFFHKNFDDFFTIWHPKDIVGGDIYLAEEINNDEWIIMVIDCTGHGVPGAFVTMLVKAVERQLIANIHRDETISPAKILGIFNRSIKHLLKQEDINSISNAGFDGGILYYNRSKKLIRFAGAETPLFIFQNGTIETIKGDRHSIGYKKSDASYEFTDHNIDISIPTQIYLSTDGYFDQNGGEKGFPLGKKRFVKLLQENVNKPFKEQQHHLLNELQKYQSNYPRNDDVTIIGLKF